MQNRKRRKRPEPLDSFELTPPRRYDEPPSRKMFEPELPRGKKEPLPPKMTRHYVDIPRPKVHAERLIGGAVAAVFLLACNASAPLGDVPSVQDRFHDWAEQQNAQVLTQLPGNTPEPGTELYAAIHFDQQAQEEILTQTPAPTRNPEEQVSVVKHYAKGELTYHTDKISVEIEQKTKDKMTYFVADIQLSDVSQLRTAFAGGEFKSGVYEATSDIAARYSPVLAINADFCRYHRDGVIIRNGEVLRRQNIAKHHLLIVDQDGNLSAETDRSGKQGIVANRLEEAKTWQTFEFGPVLVENGQAASLPKSFYVNCNDGYYEPRTAIGQVGPLHYVVIVVDGRRDGYSRGASIPELQQLFLDEGVQFAFNLDGGGSTTLYFLGDVINAPSGNKERSVSDAIMFMANPR